ncbi:MAG: hypothetical protein OXQ93_06545 [Gemmatimonadota bacterium]|nr:hypothetical protein [Gemmatimonadota bacterium]
MSDRGRRWLGGVLALLIHYGCGVPEGDLSPSGPLLGDWGTTVAVGELEAPAEEVFGRIRAVALFARGGLVVLDAQAGRAVGFGDRGSHAFTLGRRGQGPGEFVDPSALFRISDDTLAFLNRSARTLQLFARQAGDPFAEIGRSELPFWPSGGCSMRGRIFILGGFEDRAVHEVDREGVIVKSFPSSDYAGEVAEGAPEAIAWDLRDQARSGLLVCSEVSGHVIHAPYRLGWARTYTAGGDLAWHAFLPDFVKGRVVPAMGGGAVKYEFDPDFNYSHSVVGAAVVANSHVALSVSVAVPRDEEPEVEGLLALLDLATGEQTRRDEFAGVVMAGRGGQVAVVYREPFPRVVILERGES